MSFFGKWNSVALAALMGLAAGGCAPDSSPMDEEKEPHFVLGKSRVNAFNYPGAIEAFEESLEANPHSAKAHFELAMLYENQDAVKDPAAAIYHYQQYLKYDPAAQNADLINQRIAECKKQLAENVLQLPSAPAVQQQLEKLTDENRRLHDQLNQWQAYYAAVQAAKTNPANAGVRIQQTQPASPAHQPQLEQEQPRTGSTPEDLTQVTRAYASMSNSVTASTSTNVSGGHRDRPPAPPVHKHNYTVASGDTFAVISRKQGVSVASLEAANPSVNPRKLRAGQVINLPEP